MKFWQALDAAFPRRRDKALFFLLSLGANAGIQLAFYLTHRNRLFA